MPNYPRLLLVEDMRHWYDTVRDILVYDRRGKLCDLDWADTKERCMELVENNDYLFVLMDLSLSESEIDRQGTTLTMNLLDYFEEQGRKIPIVIFSARYHIWDEISGYNAGAFNFIKKPLKPISQDDIERVYSAIEAMIHHVESTTSPLDTLRKENVVEVGPLQLVHENSHESIYLNGRQLSLTGKPLRVLAILMAASTPVSRETLMEQVDIKDNNGLSVYLSNIRRELRGSGVSVNTEHGRCTLKITHE